MVLFRLLIGYKRLSVVESDLWTGLRTHGVCRHMVDKTMWTFSNVSCHTEQQAVYDKSQDTLLCKRHHRMSDQMSD